MIHGPWQCLSGFMKMAQVQDTDTKNQIAVCRKYCFDTLKVLQSKFVPKLLKYNVCRDAVICDLSFSYQTVVSNDTHLIQQLLPCQKVQSVKQFIQTKQTKFIVQMR